MSPNTLPPEICRTIARWADVRDLPALARTSRTMQIEAEALIWRSIESYHNFEVYKILRIVAECPRVGHHVRCLWLMDDRSRLRRRQNLNINVYETFENREYWVVVRRALLNMPNLDVICITDPLMENSWIFEPMDLQPGANQGGTGVAVRSMPCQIREARLCTFFTSSVAAFLEDQQQLRSLYIYDIAQNIPRPPISQAALLKLAAFEGPPILLDQLYHCPLTQIKLSINGEDSVSLLPVILPELCRFKNLRSLCIGMIPEEMSLECANLITNACPSLTYLAFLPYPWEHASRVTFLKCLTRLRHLRALELEIAHWVPAVSGQFQRALVVEIHMCVPTLNSLCFWAGLDRWFWQWSTEHVQIPAIPHSMYGFLRTEEEEEQGENGEMNATHGKGGAGGAGAGVLGNMKLDLEPGEDPGLLAWKYTWGQNVWPMQSNSWRNVKID